MEQVVTEVAVGYVHTVAHPRLLFVIHMEDKESIARTAIIPSFLPAVLQQIELVAVSRTANDIGLAAIAQRFHVLDGCRLSQLHRSSPSQVHLLHGREVRRAPSFVRIVTAVHEVPLIHCRESGCVKKWIDVGQSQCVAELMNDGTDAAQGIVFPQFTADRSVACCDSPRQLNTRDSSCVRPDIARHHITRIAGYHKYHLINLVIPIPVVYGEVGLLCLTQYLEGLPDITIAVNRRFMSTCLTTYLYRSVDVELQVATAP